MVLLRMFPNLTASAKQISTYRHSHPRNAAGFNKVFKRSLSLYLYGQDGLTWAEGNGKLDGLSYSYSTD